MQGLLTRHQRGRPRCSNLSPTRHPLLATTTTSPRAGSGHFICITSAPALFRSNDVLVTWNLNDDGFDFPRPSVQRLRAGTRTRRTDKTHQGERKAEKH
ncbi:hypothetical protein BDI4_120124 [Burkholderia diffusa]|nr:hypothetical protein BDI4_120124 [Burkholderia diffusa]